MGTRNLTSVIVDGQTKVAQYGQWDGYPSGQGDTIAKFLRAHSDDEITGPFAGKVRACSFLTEEDVQALFASVYPDKAGGNGWMTLEEAKRWKNTYPHLDRDTGAQILNLIWAEGPLSLEDESAFFDDRLFCEWAYFIDLDAKTVRVVGYDRYDVTLTFDQFRNDEHLSIGKGDEDE